MAYDEQDLKIPVESKDYAECSQFVTNAIETIIQAAIKTGENQIIINTNLRLGLPMENINKVAGPFVEAWAVQTFHDVVEDKKNEFSANQCGSGGATPQG